MTVSELEARITTLEKEVASLREQLEYARTVAGIKRGLQEADRGLGIPLSKADEQLRSKYNIQRS